MGILGQQLVGVAEQRRRGGQDGGDPEGQQATGPAAHDAVDEHEPGAEAGHLDELQVVVVEAPQVDERRQQQRPAPRVGVRAEAPAGVDHREAVVGDDLSRGCRRRCCGPGADRARSRRLGCGRCGAGRWRARPPTATTMPRASPLASRLRRASRPSFVERPAQPSGRGRRSWPSGSLTAAALLDGQSALGDLVGAEHRALPRPGVTGLLLPRVIVVGVRGVGRADLADAILGRCSEMSAASERVNGSSSSCGTTWLTRPRRRASSASMKLPVKLISRARRTPIACGSSTVRPHARHHPDAGVGVAELGPLGGDEEVAVEGDLEPAGDGDAVDGTDERLGEPRQWTSRRRGCCAVFTDAGPGQAASR